MAETSIFDGYLTKGLRTAPVATPEASNTFYAIYGTNCQGYLQTDGRFKCLGADAAQAKPFSSMREVLQYIAQGYCDRGRGFGPIEIRRVTRQITPGTTSRRILDHGEQAPAGAEIKFAVVNPYAATKCGCTIGDSRVKTWGAEGERLSLYNSEFDAVHAVQGTTEPGVFFIRRVAITTTDNTVTYKEEVVQ